MFVSSIADAPCACPTCMPPLHQHPPAASLMPRYALCCARGQLGFTSESSTCRARRNQAPHRSLRCHPATETNTVALKGSRALPALAAEQRSKCVMEDLGRITFAALRAGCCRFYWWRLLAHLLTLMAVCVHGRVAWSSQSACLTLLLLSPHHLVLESLSVELA
jgi:hypothetical protein